LNEIPQADAIMVLGAYVHNGQPAQALAESLAKVKAFIDVEIMRRDPRFLGDPIPIAGSGLETEG